MAFIALRFDADSDDAERWSDALIAAGALSVDLADSSTGTEAELAPYGAPAAEQERLWAKSRLTALFAGGCNVRSALGAAAGAIGQAVPPYSIEEIADADWVRVARAQFEPLHVTGDLWIVPSWREPVDARALNLRIDPGLAFGTGSHPTTHLCLRWLAERPPRGAQVLDYGCGSGILAITAAKLGAATVTGVDVDAQAIAVSRANAEANGVSASFGAPEQIVGIRKPEAAGKERTLAGRQSVIGPGCAVAMYKPVDEQIALDCFHRGTKARIGGRQESDRGNQQQARVELFASVGLNEAAKLPIESVAADVVVDLGP